MITLILLAYIILSLYFSISNTKDRYNIFGEKFKAMETKKAFIEGFLTLPIMTLIVIIPFCLAIGAGLLLLTVCSWIFVNMP